MNRILQVGLSDNPGGVENVVMNYYQAIHKQNFQFDFLDIYDNKIAYAEQIELLGGRVLKIANYKRHPIKAYRQIKKIISDNGYKCMHVHMQSAANLLPIFAGLRENIKVIAHSHSSSTPKGIVRKIFHGINVGILRHLDIEKYACGIRAGEWMWGKSFDGHNVILNATNLRKFQYNEEIRSEIRKEIGYNNCFVLGFVGRFGQEKNTGFLIDVLEELVKIDGTARLLTVGGNDLYDEFVRNISKKNLKKYYYSAGIQKDASNWYQVFDVFLMPSFFEGYPMVGIEAQASGLPCFLSDRISKEINITGKVEFLPINNKSDAKEWARKILKCKGQGRSETSNLLSNYDIGNVVSQIEDIYSKILK